MRGVSNRNLLEQSLLNNSFDLPYIEAVLEKVYHNSFKYLYKSQKELVGLYRFNLTSEDFHEEDGRISLTVDKDLIEQVSRKSYRTSLFFGRELTLSEISNNRDVFVKTVLVFIDGLSTFYYTVKPDNDKTTLYFNMDKDLLYGDHEITVLFIYNNGFQTVTTNKYVLKKYENQLPMKLFSQTLPAEGEGLNFSFISDSTSTLGSAFNESSVNDKLLRINSSAHATEIIKSSKEFNVTVINIRHIYTTGDEYNVVQREDGSLAAPLFIPSNNGSPYSMPIPESNVLVFKYSTEHEDFMLSNSAHVALHYPFIYEILDDEMQLGDRYKIFYFYHHGTDAVKYENKIRAYLNLVFQRDSVAETLEDALNNIYLHSTKYNDYRGLFPKYFNFVESDMKYNLSDYFNESPEHHHFDYKIKKMKEFILHDPDCLREYVKSQKRVGRSFFLFVKNINLGSRYRINNFPEAAKSIDRMTFDEPCYVFAFNNDASNKLNLRFFIDGIHFVPKYTTINKYMEYIYIPVRLIKSNSYIEIERFDWYVYQKTVKFNKDDPGIYIEIPEPIFQTCRPTYQDLFFIDLRSGAYIDKSKIETFVEIDNTNTKIPPEKFTPLKSFTIKITDETLHGVNILVVLNKVPFLREDKRRNSDFGSIASETGLNNDIAFFRMFVNGRNIPEQTYRVTDFKYTSAPMVDLLYRLVKGDNVVLDVTPFKYKKICEVAEIPENALLDLKGVISKPFDLSYYDMYLNGRKLTDVNVIRLSPTKIKLINIRSKYNLIILEKDRDGEFFDLRGDDEYFSCEDELLENFTHLTDDDKNIIVRDLIEQNKNENVEIGDNEFDEDDILTNSILNGQDADMQKFFRDELCKVLHLNPDKKQFTRENLLKYPYIASIMKSDSTSTGDPNVVHIFPDDCPTAINIIRINPNESMLSSEIKSFTINTLREVDHYNPDQLQFDRQEIEEEYPNVAQLYLVPDEQDNVLKLNPDINAGSVTVQYLSSNELINK